MESAIDFYEEVLDTFVDPPAEPNTPIWPCLVNRPGLDLYAGPSEGPAGAHVDLPLWYCRP